MKRIWGFDLGTTSVGFSVIDLDEEKQQGKIVREGVRIFPEGVTEKEQEPRNKERRLARMARRQHRRRRLRRRFLRQALAEAGLLPWINNEEREAAAPFRKLPRGSAASSEWVETAGTDPYELRARALTEKLEPFEISRALYHLAQRRGFTSARLDDTRDDDKSAAAKKKEEGKVKEGISSLQKKMGDRTLGEYLATLPEPERKRGCYIGRDMIEEEFNRIWSAQHKFHPALLTDNRRETIRAIIFYQRPVFWRLKTLGQCWLEPGEPPCPKFSWLGQQFVLLQTVNDLRVRLAGEHERKLNDGERTKVLALMRTQATATWPKVCKALGFPKGTEFTHEDSLKTMRGNIVESKLAKVFGKDWDDHPSREALLRELYNRIYQIRYHQLGKKKMEIRFPKQRDEQKATFIESAQSDYNITREQATAIAELELPNDWLRFSEKAVRKLLPHLEKGLGLHDKDGALDQAYPDHRAPEIEDLDKLPSRTLMRRDKRKPDSAAQEIPDLRSPTVMRGLHELRKVVNNLIREYGKPDLIRVELARELKLSRDRKNKLRKFQNQRERLHKQAITDLEEHGAQNPSGLDIEKWLLWKECKQQCPYTGKKISYEALFRHGDFQVEHIVPRSRSLNNNFMNKTLCHADVNRDKGNRTPFEFFRETSGGNLREWNKAVGRIKKLVDDKRMDERKANRFLSEEPPESFDEMSERQLRETGYIATEAKKLLLRLGVKDGVQVSNGQATYQLRRLWGLNKILDPEQRNRKNREDHRHHAVDALAVALTTPAFIKRLSDHYAKQEKVEKHRFPEPWPGFWSEAKEKTDGIIVSHRTRRKVSGALHEQTYYGDTGEETEDGKYHKYVTRKPLREFDKISQIEQIRDPEVRRIVTTHVEKHGGDVKKAMAAGLPGFVNKDTGEIREIKKVRVLFKRKPDLMVEIRSELKSHADKGVNHHVVIFAKEDGEIYRETVSRFEANRRRAANEPVIRRDPPRGGEFVMTLALGDTLQFPDRVEGDLFVVVRKVKSDGQITIKSHVNARKGMEGATSPSYKTLIRDGARKVSVDPIGRVRPAND